MAYSILSKFPLINKRIGLSSRNLFGNTVMKGTSEYVARYLTKWAVSNCENIREILNSNILDNCQLSLSFELIPGVQSFDHQSPSFIIPNYRVRLHIVIWSILFCCRVVSLRWPGILFLYHQSLFPNLDRDFIQQSNHRSTFDFERKIGRRK